MNITQAQAQRFAAAPPVVGQQHDQQQVSRVVARSCEGFDHIQRRVVGACPGRAYTRRSGCGCRGVGAMRRHI